MRPTTRHPHLSMCMLFLALLAASRPPAVAASTTIIPTPTTRGAAVFVTFTLKVKSAYLRSAPFFAATRTYSIFQNQTFAVTGRTPAGDWLQIAFTGASRGTWIPTAYGEVKGNLVDVPIITVERPSLTPTPAVIQLPAMATTAKFTIGVQSAFARSRPSLAGQRARSVFKGQTYPVRARNAGGDWLWIDIAGATTPTWLPTAYGTLRGDIDNVPIHDQPPAPTVMPVLPFSGAADPVIPAVSARTRQIYRTGLALGNRPRAFSKVGDCQSVTAYFLGAFENPTQYRLGNQYAYLQETIDHYRGSFGRNSLAVSGGFNIASVLDPAWANPRYCTAGETPLACEFRLHRPSLVIISMETWWNGRASTYEANLRQVVEFAIAHGVVPILATKADNVEGDGSINAAIVRVAHEYDVPLRNFWLAVQPLPGHGLVSNDGFHLTYDKNYFDDAQAMQNAWPWRNLTALQALAAVRAGLQ